MSNKNSKNNDKIVNINKLDSANILCTMPIYYVPLANLNNILFYLLFFHHGHLYSTSVCITRQKHNASLQMARTMGIAFIYIFYNNFSTIKQYTFVRYSPGPGPRVWNRSQGASVSTTGCNRENNWLAFTELYISGTYNW